MAKIIIKTPTKNYELKDKVKKNAEWTEEMKSRVAEVALGKLSKNVNIAMDRQVSVIATFFQRVVARTPIDEKYLRSNRMIKDRKTGQLKPDEHIPDKGPGAVCQDDWYITDGRTKFTSAQMKAIDKELFWNVNEKYSVNQVKKIIQEKFNITPETVFTIGNNNPHFQALEEGYEDWKNDGLRAVKNRKEGIRREHGVENMHSIQAPVGMWRISMAELEVMVRSKAISPLTSRYRAQYGRIMRKPPNKAKLLQFMKLLESKKDITYADIARYVERY